MMEERHNHASFPFQKVGNKMYFFCPGYLLKDGRWSAEAKRACAKVLEEAATRPLPLDSEDDDDVEPSSHGVKTTVDADPMVCKHITTQTFYTHNIVHMFTIIHYMKL
jgi:hypothetical protein